MLKSMLQHLRDARAEELEGEGAGEAGFTLIELMVVLLIIAILLAIAIPTFLGVTSSANDRAAQSNLTNAITEGSALYQNNNQAFPTDASFATYQASAPEFTWTNGAVSAQNHVSIAVSADQQAILYGVYSPGTHTCWYALYTPSEGGPGFGAGGADVLAVANAGTYYAKQTGVASTTGCSSVAAYAVANYQAAAGWGPNYGAAPND